MASSLEWHVLKLFTFERHQEPVPLWRHRGLRDDPWPPAYEPRRDQPYSLVGPSAFQKEGCEARCPPCLTLSLIPSDSKVTGDNDPFLLCCQRLNPDDIICVTRELIAEMLDNV